MHFSNYIRILLLHNCGHNPNSQHWDCYVHFENSATHEISENNTHFWQKIVSDKLLTCKKKLSIESSETLRSSPLF